MRARSTRILLFIVTALLAPAAVAAEVEIHSEQQSYLLGAARRVHVNLSLGEVRVEGTETDRVEIDYRLTCTREDIEKCRQEARRVRVVPRIRGDKFLIGLKNARRGRIRGVKVEIRLRIPQGVPLDIDLENGDVFVTRMLSDVVVSGARGDVDVIAPHEQAGQVNVKVVAGKAELWMGDGYLKGSGFPKAINWHGQGSSKIAIHLGTGDVRVRLE